MIVKGDFQITAVQKPIERRKKAGGSKSNVSQKKQSRKYVKLIYFQALKTKMRVILCFGTVECELVIVTEVIKSETIINSKGKKLYNKLHNARPEINFTYMIK